jgi:membrane-associated protein
MLSAILASGFLNPEQLIKWGGLPIVSLIVFAESGLFFGFFLPGDSLLFVTGFLSGGGKLPGLAIVLVCVFAAAFLGDQVGFWFGHTVGPALFKRPDSRFFKQEYVAKAHGFFERHGAKTIVLARFVPIVRTFAPIVAGVGRMRYRTFVVYNAIGAAAWAVGVTVAGYYLGNIEWVKNRIEIVLPLIVVLSLVPMIIEVLRHRRKRSSQPVVVDAAD